MNTRPALLTALLATQLACGEASPPAVTVGPVSYDQNELLGLSTAHRRELGRLAAFGLSVADSSEARLGRPAVQRWEEDLLLDLLAAHRVLADAGVDDPVLEARYLTDPEYELTVRHILFFSERWRTPTHRAEAERKATRALTALRGGADFAETAARLSEEPGAEGRQGLLSPGREGAWVDEFWTAASALEVGEISAVTETEYGYHILRLGDRKIVPFPEARAVVIRELAPRVGDPLTLVEAWRSDEEAREEALDDAEELGLILPPGELEALRRRWSDMTHRWAAALGFRYGLSPDQVAVAARRALALSAQGAVIARKELADIDDVLRARYEIEVAEAR